MAEARSFATTRGAGAVEVNRVLRNTYLLLGMTLAFSAVVATVAYATGAPHLGFFPTLIGFFAVLFLVHRTADSVWGLPAAFLFTGFLGYTLGPLLSVYLALPNGAALVGHALGLTAIAFVGLSGYVVVSRRDFSYLRAFLVTGCVVLLGGMLLNYFLALPAMAIAISCGVVLFACALILFETSAVVQGGETNYIRATVGLYVSIYNLFVSLLQLLGIFGGDD